MRNRAKHKEIKIPSATFGMKRATISSDIQQLPPFRLNDKMKTISQSALRVHEESDAN